MNQLIKIYRSPDDGADVGGAEMLTEQTSIDTSSGNAVSTAETISDGTSEGQKPQPQLQDKSKAVQLSELKTRVEKDPNYKFTDEDHTLIELESLGKIDEEENPKVDAPKKEEIKTPIQDALKEVGAKSEAELVTKIKDLKKFISGRDSQAYAYLEKQHKELVQKAENHQKWLIDLSMGKADAIDYFQTLTGNSLNAKNDLEDIFDPDEFISTDAGLKANKFAKSIIEQNKKLVEQIEELRGMTRDSSEFYKQQAEKAQIENARAQIESDRSSIKSELASIAEMPEFRDILKPTSGTIYQLLDEYWRGNDGDPIDPRIAPIIDVIDNAKQLSGLELKEALLKGAKLATFGKTSNKNDNQKKIQPSVNIASAGNKNINSNYNETDIKAMLSNPSKIPSAWMDSDGDLIVDRIPTNLRQYVV